MLNLRNVGDSKFTAHHTVLVEMCLHLKPTAFRRLVVHTINVVPFGMADSIDVDGIHILSADKYDLWYFEIVVVPYEPKQ